jgi:2,3-bisphosphoglycerate-independent phosphoglycerate mutase
MLVTADHGNAEQMLDRATGQPHTAHTVSAVPLVYYGGKLVLDPTGGALCDVALTLLELTGVRAPEEMNGRTLLRGVA